MSYPHLGPLLRVLATIAGEPRVGMDRLEEVTGLSRKSIHRHLQAARDYGVIIEREGNQQNHYVIRDWGAINPAWLNRRQPPQGSVHG